MNAEKKPPVAELLSEAYFAAVAFIDSHVCDPGITPEASRRYKRYLEAKAKLEQRCFKTDSPTAPT